MLTQSLISLFSKETIGTLIAAIPLIKIILNYFNKPLEETNEIYKKAKVRTWKVRFFMVKVSTKKIPKLTYFDATLFSIILFFLSGTVVTSSYYGLKLLQIRDGWTSLILKETNEWFLITMNKASEHAFKPSWYITEESCNSGVTKKLIKEGKITPQLSQFICESFTQQSYKVKIAKSIKETIHKKYFLAFVITIIVLGCLWFIMSLILTIIYTLRLKKF
ncbi:DUF6216 family protein, partial [Pseudescherichia vulneris]|uniref:DUF6216 family protein n=1 Tax=Pseudescherichia vulneris TaxID=566 RepID=UPI0030C916FD